MNSQPRQLLYIMSPSYSGSTLLTSLLAPHPDIATIGELKASKVSNTEGYRCSCGELITECDFWRTITEKITAQGGFFSVKDWRTHFASDNPVFNRIIRPVVHGPILETLRRYALQLVPGCQQALSAILDANQQVIEAVCQTHQASVFLDGSKDPLRVKYFYESGRWEMKVIFLTRDGRGTSNSDKKYSNRNIAEAAKQWREKIVEMELIANMLPDSQLLRLKYESLCDETEETLALICQFAGIAPFDAVQRRSAALHILGNDKMRLGAVNDVRLDEKWKRELNSDELDSFSEVAGLINSRLGYQ